MAKCQPSDPPDEVGEEQEWHEEGMLSRVFGRQLAKAQDLVARMKCAQDMALGVANQHDKLVLENRQLKRQLMQLQLRLPTEVSPAAACRSGKSPPPPEKIEAHASSLKVKAVFASTVSRRTSHSQSRSPSPSKSDPLKYGMRLSQGSISPRRGAHKGSRFGCVLKSGSYSPSRRRADKIRQDMATKPGATSPRSRRLSDPFRFDASERKNSSSPSQRQSDPFMLNAASKPGSASPPAGVADASKLDASPECGLKRAAREGQDGGDDAGRTAESQCQNSSFADAEVNFDDARQQWISDVTPQHSEDHGEDGVCVGQGRSQRPLQAGVGESDIMLSVVEGSRACDDGDDDGEDNSGRRAQSRSSSGRDSGRRGQRRESRVDSGYTIAVRNIDGQPGRQNSADELSAPVEDAAEQAGQHPNVHGKLCTPKAFEDLQESVDKLHSSLSRIELQLSSCHTEVRHKQQLLTLDKIQQSVDQLWSTLTRCESVNSAHSSFSSFVNDFPSAMPSSGQDTSTTGPGTGMAGPSHSQASAAIANAQNERPDVDVDANGLMEAASRLLADGLLGRPPTPKSSASSVAPTVYGAATGHQSLFPHVERAQASSGSFDTLSSVGISGLGPRAFRQTPPVREEDEAVDLPGSIHRAHQQRNDHDHDHDDDNDDDDNRRSASSSFNRCFDDTQSTFQLDRDQDRRSFPVDPRGTDSRVSRSSLPVDPRGTDSRATRGTDSVASRGSGLRASHYSEFNSRRPNFESEPDEELGQLASSGVISVSTPAAKQSRGTRSPDMLSNLGRMQMFASDQCSRVGMWGSAQIKAQRGGVFCDAAVLKGKLRMQMAKPKYNVQDFYWKEGIFQCIAKHRRFEQLTLSFIAVNAIWIAVDADRTSPASIFREDEFFRVGDNIFCNFFLLELFIRFMAFQCKRNCLKDRWFMFDLALVSTMVFETWILALIIQWVQLDQIIGATHALKLLRLVRLSRMARLIRLLRAIPELVILLKGMLIAFRSVGITLSLLSVFVYFFAIIFRHLTDQQPIGHQYFKSVPNAMLTLALPALMLPDLATLMGDVVRAHWLYGALLLGFLLLTSITVMNMLIGILCDVVNVVASVEKEEQLLIYMQGRMRSIFDNEIGPDKETLTKDNFQNILRDEDACRALLDVGVDVLGLQGFCDFIYQCPDDELSFGEFMAIILELRGTNTATVKHVIDCQRYIHVEMRNQMTSVNERIDNIMESLTQADQNMGQLKEAVEKSLRPAPGERKRVPARLRDAGLRPSTSEVGLLW